MESCVKCRMKGYFTEIDDAQKVDTYAEFPETHLNPCRNCGADALGLVRCPVCHYPLNTTQKLTALNVPLGSIQKFILFHQIHKN